MIDREQSCKIAKILKIFGNDGSVVMRLYDDFPDEVNFEEPLFVLLDELATPLFFNLFQRRGKDKALVRFDDIDTPYRAGFVIGREAIAYVDEQEVEEDGELYYEDMIGFRLVDLSSGREGKIVEYIDSENNPLFEIEMEGVSVMIPVADDLIEEIDRGGRSIFMTLPDGLIDLYFE